MEHHQEVVQVAEINKDAAKKLRLSNMSLNCLRDSHIIKGIEKCI